MGKQAVSSICRNYGYNAQEVFELLIEQKLLYKERINGKPYPEINNETDETEKMANGSSCFLKPKNENFSAKHTIHQGYHITDHNAST